MDAYDVIVVGAGNGGLTAAATTAKQGLKTLLLEKHNIPGGCASSFRRGRFEFETTLHEMSGYGNAEAPGQVRKLFEALGVRAEMIPVEDAFRAIVTGPDGYDVTLPTGIEAFVAKMEQTVAGSGKSVSDFFKLAGDVGRAMGYLGKGAPDPAVLAAEHLNFMKVAAQPVGAVLDDLGMPKRAQEIFMTYWPYCGTPRSEFSFVLYALMVNNYISQQAYITKDRSHEISLALEECVRNYGGEIWYNTEVTKLLIKDGRCYGVVIAGGRELRAKQVIANISPNRVFGSMVDESEAPKGEIKRANARKVGMTGFCVYLGLDKSPEELGIKDYSVFISSTADSDEQFRRMHTLEENDFFIMNCLNIDNPDCSPPGTSLLWSTTLYGPEVWASVKPSEYKATKNRLAKKMIDQYEAATGIRIHDCIEEISVTTPATFARYLHTPNGAIYGYHNQLWDTMLPRVMSMRDEQYVQGLRFCGGHSTLTLGYGPSYENGQMMGSLAALDIKEGR